jgi:ATP-dependent Lhr-like helicase
LYATNRWTLLQSVACWLLYDEKYIEPVSLNEKPYDILVHQMLVYRKRISEFQKKLIAEMRQNTSFKSDDASEIRRNH